MYSWGKLPAQTFAQGIKYLFTSAIISCWGNSLEMLTKAWERLNLVYGLLGQFPDRADLLISLLINGPDDRRLNLKTYLKRVKRTQLSLIVVSQQISLRWGVRGDDPCWRGAWGGGGGCWVSAVLMAEPAVIIDDRPARWNKAGVKIQISARDRRKLSSLTWIHMALRP